MTDLQIVYVVVFAVMSIVGFLSMYVDKTKAKRRKWRTPEWVLFLIAVLFGGVGQCGQRPVDFRCGNAVQFPRRFERFFKTVFQLHGFLYRLLIVFLSVEV